MKNLKIRHLLVALTATAILVGLTITLYSCMGNSSSGNSGGQTDSESIDEYYEGSESDNEQAMELPTFHTEMDVISFLNLKVFEDEQGNTLQIKTDAIYFNGEPVTTAPRSKEFSGCEATIVAKDPAGYNTTVLWLVENSGKLFIKDTYSGVNYYMK